MCKIAHYNIGNSMNSFSKTFDTYEVYLILPKRLKLYWKLNS